MDTCRTLNTPVQQESLCESAQFGELTKEENIFVAKIIFFIPFHIVQ